MASTVAYFPSKKRNGLMPVSPCYSVKSNGMNFLPTPWRQHHASHTKRQLPAFLRPAGMRTGNENETRASVHIMHSPATPATAWRFPDEPTADKQRTHTGSI